MGKPRAGQAEIAEPASRKIVEARVKESKTVFRGRIFHVTRDSVEEPGGVTVVREIVRHAGSAVILPRRDDGRILLVRQFRLAPRRLMWELAAGRLDAGETPLEAAQRELEEETAFRADRWELLAEFYPSPGYVDEKMWLFLAEGLHRGKANPDPDERIRRRWFTVEQMERLVRTRKIEDAKTLVGFFLIRETQPASSRIYRR